MSKGYNEALSYTRAIGFDLRQSYNGDLLEYIGYAYPGAKDDEEKWQIMKFGYDGSNRITRRKYADATDDYVKKWSLRINYTYLGI